MKKIAIALTALAGIMFMSGCAYDYYGHYAYGYGSGPSYGHPYYNSLGWDCANQHWNPIYCQVT